MTDYKKLCEVLAFNGMVQSLKIVEQMHKEIEELQAENQRLKKQLDEAVYRMQKMAIEIKWLRGEDGKA